MRYTPEPNLNGYPDEVRHQAIQLYVDGGNLRRIGRHLGVSSQSAANWVNAQAAGLPETPQSAENETVELDELFTFIGEKKNKAYILKAVDRQMRCIVGWEVVWERKPKVLQHVVDQGHRARQYFSDQWELYQLLVYYPGKHTVSDGKRDTYSLEADNAELQHFLARLVRRSRCFSRCIKALCYAVKFLVYAFNRRQLFKWASPKFPAYVFQFVIPS